MKVKFRQEQFKNAVQYVMRNNPNAFTSQFIADAIRNSIHRVASDKEVWYSGTMGFYVLASDEAWENGEKIVWVEILVDPALGSEEYTMESREIFGA